MAEPQKKPLTAAEQAQRALAIKQNGFVTTVTETQSKINELVSKRQLQLPPNYSVGNALKAAQLKIMEVTDKNDKPALEVCTQQSIANALLSMAIQGLTPVKLQCYFLVRGDKLCLDVSYFGKKAIAMRIDPTIDDIITRGVRKGEKFEFKTLPNGKYEIIEHEQTLESLDSSEFTAGYATIIYKNGKPPISDIMTWNRILKSWEKSPQKDLIGENGKLKKGSVHSDFTEEMIGRTLMNHITKTIINSSNDGDLLHEMIEANELDNAEAAAQEKIAANANTGEVIDIKMDKNTGEIIDADYKDVQDEPEDAQDAETPQAVEELNEENNATQAQNPSKGNNKATEPTIDEDGQIVMGAIPQAQGVKNKPFQG